MTYLKPYITSSVAPLISIAFLLLIGIAGCDDQRGTAATSATSPTSPTSPTSAERAPKPASNLDLQPTHPQPEYTLAIAKSETAPATYTVVWSVRVDSSGWKLTTEQVLIEDYLGGNIARVTIIVHEPQPGDSVTEGFQTLYGRHDAGITQIQRAELTAKHTVRDSKPKYPQLYSVVMQVGG